jgi:hypothetical protein
MVWSKSGSREVPAARKQKPKPAPAKLPKPITAKLPDLATQFRLVQRAGLPRPPLPVTRSLDSTDARDYS